MFLALRYQPGFGPLAVAYAAANIASAIPITPGGLGVIEVTLVAVTVGFGAPRATAVLAVLGYRIVNYWLPLIPGAIAYLRLRLSAPSLAAAARREPDRAVLFYAADDGAAGDLVAGLIRGAGFDPVRVGGLDQSIRLEMFGDLHEYGALGRVVTRAEALKAL